MNEEIRIRKLTQEEGDISNWLKDRNWEVSELGCKLVRENILVEQSHSFLEMNFMYGI